MFSTDALRSSAFPAVAAGFLALAARADTPGAAPLATSRPPSPEPKRTAGLLIIDTDYPDPDPHRFCTFAGVSCKVPAEYLKSDALAIGLTAQVSSKIHPLRGVPVRVITSDQFDPGCYFFWTTCDEKRVNRRVVEFQRVAWGELSSDFRQTVVHVQHDVLLDAAHHEIVAAVDSILSAQ